MPFSILIVDDELEVCLSLREILESRGYGVCHETSATCVSARIEDEPVDLAIVDVRMPALGGIDLLKLLRERHPGVPVIMMSGHPSVENAVRSMKYGAINFYAKPIRLPELLHEIKQLESSQAARRAAAPSDRLVTRNPGMMEVLGLASKAAPTDAPVVLTGESGTGKELVADLLHHTGRRSESPYIKINCAAIPDTLLESEMFGHEKGAFTDAQTLQKGKIELAHGGTIFFDEIGDMSLTIQAKMLRVLQEKRFMRLGGTEPVRADFRVIAATNRNLQDLISDGRFREDLFYRLSVITLTLPPLRERPEDIVPLAEQFVDDFAAVYGKRIRGLSEEVRRILQSHSWPGNVRELKNIVERAVIFCESDRITIADIPESYRNIESDRRENLETIEQEISTESSRLVILEALRRSNGIKGEAARLLNITRKTLYNRMKRLNLE